MLFSLDSNQLKTIDNLPEKTKTIVIVSFHKAVTGLYGQDWAKFAESGSRTNDLGKRHSSSSSSSWKR